MEAQGAINFELLFAEELIQGRLMRKGGITPLVIDYIIIFVAGER